MASHELKINSADFISIISDLKKFEIRKNSRNFQKGDMLFLLEYDDINTKYTGRVIQVIVTYILEKLGHALHPGYCIMSLGKPILLNSTVYDIVKKGLPCIYIKN